MNIYKLQNAPDVINTKIKQTTLKFDKFSVRFGRDLLFFTDKMPDAELKQHLESIYSSPDEFLLLEWHIVVQKERLFQRHFPKIPIVYDAGRYLLVRLDPEYVKELKGKKESCYRFIPLKRSQVVFRDVDLSPFQRSKAKSIKNIVDSLDRSNVETILMLLTSFHTRFWTSPEYMDAALQMGDLLKKMNYTVNFKSIGTSGKKSLNVIADKQGSGSGTHNVIIVSAHLDSINREKDGVPRPDGEFPAPGADDNASGCAGLMEIARVFQSYKGKHDLRLILFGGEEKDFIGSKEYVYDLVPAEKKRLKAIVNMDMIGFLDSPPQRVLINGSSFYSSEVMNGLLESASTYTSLSHIETTFNDEPSDHLPFIWNFLPAVLTCEGNPASAGAVPRIHSANDTPGTINYDLALKILQMNVGYIAKELGIV